jgi:hypothetical protein
MPLGFFSTLTTMNNTSGLPEFPLCRIQSVHARSYNKLHLDHQPDTLETTVQALRQNTYVDNLMQISDDIEELSKFKEEATHIFESAQFPIHKWESNVLELDTEPNPSEILGLFWDKREDSLEIKVDARSTEGSAVTKRTILS